MRWLHWAMIWPPGTSHSSCCKRLWHFHSKVVLGVLLAFHRLEGIFKPTNLKGKQSMMVAVLSDDVQSLLELPVLAKAYQRLEQKCVPGLKLAEERDITEVHVVSGLKLGLIYFSFCGLDQDFRCVIWDWLPSFYWGAVGSAYALCRGVAAQQFPGEGRFLFINCYFFFSLKIAFLFHYFFYIHLCYLMKSSNVTWQWASLPSHEEDIQLPLLLRAHIGKLDFPKLSLEDHT